ncbi:ankyrin repeat protein [Rutstroemia sp. NJR-2017a WRK4]|nr:ankyrin repeat protein [Rutstroemia sp. NJR-2017a WRK4]
MAELIKLPMPPNREATSLWETAYNELRKTECRLIEDLEAVIKTDASLSSGTDLKDQIDRVVKFQKERMESKQWSFPWLNKTLKAREVVGNIFSMLNKSSGLISMGMNFAPVYVSIPWSAVAALVPLMMSDVEKHQEALEGLEQVTKIIWCYSAAEKELLENPTTRDCYSEYFGQNTLKRIWKNATGSTSWSDNSTKIVTQDDNCRRVIQLLGFGQLQYNLEKQRSALNQIIQFASNLEKEKRDILSWISTVPYGADHDNVRERLGKDYQYSGRWLFKHPRFQKWQHSSSGVFCLRGTAGTGKSSLTSIVIQDLLDHPNGYLAYFYCSRKEKTTQRNDTTMIVRTLVKALSVSGHPAFEAFSENYRNSETQREGGCQLQLPSCLSLLSRSVDDNPSMSVILVIDAIDECAEPNELLKCLQEIRGSESKVRNIRIFISSRDGPNVKRYLPDMLEVDIAVNNREDIRSYLDKEVASRRDSEPEGESVMTDQQALELRHVLLEHSNGIQIDDAKIVVRKTIDDKIERLKTSNLEPIEQLNEAYDQIYAAAIRKNDPNRHVIVNNALQWLLCSYRELKIEELLVAVSVTRDGTIYEDLNTLKLKKLLSNFMIKAPSGEVKFAHLTIRPYLEKKMIDKHFIFESMNANLTAALTCLHVLRFPGTVNDHSPDDHRVRIDSSGSLDISALTAYSSSYWSSHSRAASKPEDPPEELRNLLESIHGSLNLASSDVSTWTSFHDAIKRDQNEVVEYLFASNFSMDQQDKLGNTPLHEAVQYKNSQAVRLLLLGGAAIQMKNNNGNTALHLAVYTSEYGILNQLLRKEASPMEWNSAGQAPIHIAALHGCIEALRAFISASLDIDYKDNFGNSSLHYSALTNQPNIALMLIQAGCAMNPQNEEGNSPLHFATKAAFEDLAALLLGNGAKMSTQNNDSQTPMDPEFLIGLPSPVTSSLLTALATEKCASMVVPECALDVETAGLCSVCANFSFWLSTAVQSMFHGHHTSYNALQQSAAQGCKLCKVISTSILADSGDMPTKKPATGLTVRILLSILRKDGNPQDLLVVRMGSEIVTSLELLGTSMYNPQICY